MTYAPQPYYPQHAQPRPVYPPQGQVQPRPRPQNPAANDPLPDPPPGTVRGVSGPSGARREARPTTSTQRVAIPSPEELGIRGERVEPENKPAVAKATPAPEMPALPSIPAMTAGSASEEDVDWRKVHRELKDLGVIRWQWERLSSGRLCFSVWVPSEAGTQLINGEGPTEIDAVRICLERLRNRRVARR